MAAPISASLCTMAANRRTVASCPRQARVSNSGGVASRPLTAMRMGINRSVRFHPRLVASSLSAASIFAVDHSPALQVAQRGQRAA